MMHKNEDVKVANSMNMSQRKIKVIQELNLQINNPFMTKL